MANKKSKEKVQNTASAKSIGFSTKNNRTPKAAAEPEKKGAKLNSKAVILVAITLVVAIAAGIIIGVFILKKNSEAPALDYMKDDLSRYITISKSDYAGYTIDIPLDSLTDALVERRINSLLTEHKKVAYDGGFMKSVALSLGDEAYIYFRGYTVDKDGRENDFEGSSNFEAEDPTIIEVGTGNVIENGSVSGQFIPGFAESLVGIVPNDHTPFALIKDGAVQRGDVIYLSYTVIGENGNKTVSAERIDLSLPYINEKYGEGFVEFFVGNGEKAAQNIGAAISDKFICKIGDNKTETVYSSMKIEYATRCESDPVTISVRFPANYSKEDLRGVEAKFDVYVRYAIIYDTPEFNDKFITETLKVKESELSEYKGNTLTEKYRAKVSAELEKEIEESNHNLLLDKMWDRLTDKVVIKELPEAEVTDFYNSYYDEISNGYAQYESYGYFSSLDDYAAYHLSQQYGKTLSAGESWKDYIRGMAESDVTQKLIFYYIIREENLIPSDAEYKKIYDRLYDELLDELLLANASQFEGLEGEKYDEKLTELKVDQILSALLFEIFIWRSDHKGSSFLPLSAVFTLLVAEIFG